MLAHQRSTFVMYDQEALRINAVIDKLLHDANATVVFLIDRNGQLISSCGATAHFDTTSLASLTAGNIAATCGLAKLIGEKEFSILFHEGEKDHIHISIVATQMILVVIFDQHSSLGLVRLRVRRASNDLARICEEMNRKTAEAEGRGSGPFNPFVDITDLDIDNLFR